MSATGANRNPIRRLAYLAITVHDGTLTRPRSSRDDS
jgi:hypothetical protein